MRKDGPLELRSQLALVRRWAWLLVLCGVGAGALTYVAYGSLPSLFEAKATVMAGQPLGTLRPTYAQVLAWPEETQTYVQIATANVVLQRAATSLGSPFSVADLRDHVSVAARLNTNIITVTAGESDPAQAAQVANQVATELVSTAPAGLLTVIDPAVAPAVASEPRVLVNTAMAALAAVLLALGFVFAKASKGGPPETQASVAEGAASDPPLNLRGQLVLFRRYLLLLVVGAVAAGGVTYLVSSRLPKTYEAAATVNVGQSLLSVNVVYNDVLASQRLAQMYARIATSRPLLDRVIAHEGISVTAAELQSRVSATAAPDSTEILVTVHDRDPDRAAVIANDISAELVAASPASRSLQPLAPTLLTTVETASPPMSAASPRTLVNTVLGSAAGLLIAVVLMYLRAYFVGGYATLMPPSRVSEQRVRHVR